MLWEEPRADEALQHTWGAFPTAPPPPEDILMGVNAGEERGKAHDMGEVAFSRLRILGTSLIDGSASVKGRSTRKRAHHLGKASRSYICRVITPPRYLQMSWRHL